ncbi:hypothetical protein [Thiomonas sp.]|jgi:hypothetical protein|nr:hypothetical protein [Thiomonas sp.]
MTQARRSPLPQCRIAPGTLVSGAPIGGMTAASLRAAMARH